MHQNSSGGSTHTEFIWVIKDNVSLHALLGEAHILSFKENKICTTLCKKKKLPSSQKALEIFFFVTKHF